MRSWGRATSEAPWGMCSPAVTAEVLREASSFRQRLMELDTEARQSRLFGIHAR